MQWLALKNDHEMFIYTCSFIDLSSKMLPKYHLTVYSNIVALLNLCMNIRSPQISNLFLKQTSHLSSDSNYWHVSYAILRKE